MIAGNPSCRWGFGGACASGGAAELAGERAIELRGLDGLCQVVVHPGGQGPLHVRAKGIRRHGQDGHGAGVRPVERADAARGGQAVHLRHPDVHQDRVKVAHGRLAEALDRDAAVLRALHAHALPLQQMGGDPGVCRVVLGQQHAAVFQRAGRDGGRSRRGGRLHGGKELQVHGERAPLPQLAAHRDAAAHPVHDGLDDRKAEPRTLRALLVGRGIPGIGLEQVGEILLTDADARVPHAALQGEAAVGQRGDAHLEVHGPALRRVLDRVGEQVEEDLVEAHAVHEERRPFLGVHEGEALLLLRAQGNGQGAHRLFKLRERIRSRVQLQLAALDAGDVQHIAGQALQVLCGRGDLRKIRARRGGVARLVLCQRGEPDDRVEGRAHVVAHARQKVGLRGEKLLGGPDLLAALAQADRERQGQGAERGEKKRCHEQRQRCGARRSGAPCAGEQEKDGEGQRHGEDEEGGFFLSVGRGGHNNDSLHGKSLIHT